MGKHVQDNDARLSDTRTPSDNSVTSAKIVDGTIVDGDINAAAAIAFTKLASSAGLSVVGRGASTTGTVAAITAANDGEVLRRSGTTVGFGTIATAGIADSAVTSAKIADGTIVNADISASAAIAPSKISGTAVITTDSRLSNNRYPTSHASSHGELGADPVSIAQSQVTDLTSSLASKAPINSPVFTGTPAVMTGATTITCDGTAITEIRDTYSMEAGQNAIEIWYASSVPSADLAAVQALALGDTLTIDPGTGTTYTKTASAAGYVSSSGLILIIPHSGSSSGYWYTGSSVTFGGTAIPLGAGSSSEVLDADLTSSVTLTASSGRNIVAYSAIGNSISVTLPSTAALSAGDTFLITNALNSGTLTVLDAVSNYLTLPISSNNTTIRFTVASTGLDNWYLDYSLPTPLSVGASPGRSLITDGTTVSWDWPSLGTDTPITRPVLTSPLESITVSATAATGTVALDARTSSVVLYTSNASGNWTLNVRGNASNTLNSMLAVGQSITVAFLVTNGSPAYYQTGFQIDGSAVTPKWQGGSAPTSGNANSIDVYTFTIIKTAATPTYTVLAQLTKFA